MPHSCLYNACAVIRGATSRVHCTQNPKIVIIKITRPIHTLLSFAEETAHLYYVNNETFGMPHSRTKKIAEIN